MKPFAFDQTLFILASVSSKKKQTYYITKLMYITNIHHVKCNFIVAICIYNIYIHILPEYGKSNYPNYPGYTKKQGTFMTNLKLIF